MNIWHQTPIITIITSSLPKGHSLADQLATLGQLHKLSAHKSAILTTALPPPRQGAQNMTLQPPQPLQPSLMLSGQPRALPQ